MKVHKVALTDSMLYTRRIINLRINDVLIVPVFSLGFERMYVRVSQILEFQNSVSLT